jgi:hypothetical protein
MAGNQARLQITIDAENKASAELKGLSNDLKDVNNSANESSGGVKVFGLSLTDLKSGVDLAMGGLEKLKQVWDFAKEGAENERIANSFEDTAASVGVSAEAMAAALDKAAKGTVDDEIAMQVATRNMALGMATDLKSNVALMELARSSSIKFGGDTEAAFEGISTAIGNLQTRSLKQYGIIVDAKEANETYAKAIGKTADQLTEAEQRTALLNAVMLKSKDIFKDTSAEVLTTSEKFKKFETQLGNLVDVAKEGAVNGLTPWLDKLSFGETLLDANATEADKLRGAYEMLRSQGVDPTSTSMELMRQKIEEADAAMQAISMSTGEAALRDNMAAAAKAQAASASAQVTTATQQSDAATKEYSNTLLYNVQKYQEQKAAAEQAAAAEAVHRSSIAESITANSNLAQSLKTATDAQAIQTLAQAQLDTLKKAYENGTISQEGFYKATDQVLLRYDLATPKSLAMADAQRAINEAFLAGDLPLKDFVTSSEKIPGIAEDGKVKLSELTSIGVKPTTEAVGEQKGKVDDLIGAWGKVPPNVKTVYTIEINGEEPSGGTSKPSNPKIPGRALGGPTGQGGLYLLHPNEFVLSEAMRMGRAPIPSSAVPAGGVGRTTITTVNLYDTLATKMYLEQQRVEDLRHIEERM